MQEQIGLELCQLHAARTFITFLASPSAKQGAWNAKRISQQVALKAVALALLHLQGCAATGI